MKHLLSRLEVQRAAHERDRVPEGPAVPASVGAQSEQRHDQRRQHSQRRAHGASHANGTG